MQPQLGLKMKYYLVAGEASGDLHGSNLIKALHAKDAHADIRCWGGELMQKAGATLVKDYKELAFMGFSEVIKNLPTIFRNLRFCKEDITAYSPDVLVLIDYPGFNLRIAKWARQQGLKVVYYISPQVWAWKESRVKTMKQHIDRMLVILPFEEKYYAEKWNWKVDYVGHPLVQAIEEWKKNNTTDDAIAALKNKYAKPLIAILPGSRRQEIQKKLPIMLQAAKNFHEKHFVVAKAPGIEDEFYESLLQNQLNVSAVRNATYSLLNHADAALVTSGTATLETALFQVPQVVCYKANNISYQIAKRLIKIKFISLVNLIMDKMVVKELIQHELTPANLISELNSILLDDAKRKHIMQDYTALKQILTEDGNASANAADIIYKESKK